MALPGSQVSRDYYAILNFCKGEHLSLCGRGHSFRRDKMDYVVKCFARREDADKLTQRFDGEYMTPTTRPKFWNKSYWAFAAWAAVRNRDSAVQLSFAAARRCAGFFFAADNSMGAAG